MRLGKGFFPQRDWKYDCHIICSVLEDDMIDGYAAQIILTYVPVAFSRSEFSSKSLFQQDAR